MNYEKYPSYKDSGVPWLGKIPQNWNREKLKYLAYIRTGEKDTVDKIENGKYPFFVRSKTVERINSFSYDEEAVLTAGDGDIGKIFHYINGKFEFHQRVYKFSNLKKITGKYLYYYLHYHLAEEVVKLSAKSTVDSLRLPMLQNFPVIIPKSEDQKAISLFLDCKTAEIDSAIAKKERLIELLKEQQSIIINNAVTKGLNSDIPMCDSGIEWIGKIPEHWNIKRSKFLFSQSRLPVQEGDGVVTAFRDGEVTLRTNRRTDGFTVAILEQGYQGIREGQLVLNSMDAFAGAIGVSDSNGKCSPEYVICDPIDVKEIEPTYFAFLLREMAMFEYIQVICPAVRQRALRIRFNNLAELFLAFPPKEEQNAIVEHIKEKSAEIENLIDKTEQEIEKLKEFKSILISEAVTGKIKVIKNTL